MLDSFYRFETFIYDRQSIDLEFLLSLEFGSLRRNFFVEGNFMKDIFGGSLQPSFSHVELGVVARHQEHFLDFFPVEFGIVESKFGPLEVINHNLSNFFGMHC